MNHSRHFLYGVSFVIKFWTDRMYGFGDIAIFRFWQFGLKTRWTPLLQTVLLFLPSPSFPEI